LRVGEKGRKARPLEASLTPTRQNLQRGGGKRQEKSWNGRPKTQVCCGGHGGHSRPSVGEKKSWRSYNQTDENAQGKRRSSSNEKIPANTARPPASTEHMEEREKMKGIGTWNVRLSVHWPVKGGCSKMVGESSFWSFTRGQNKKKKKEGKKGEAHSMDQL